MTWIPHTLNTPLPTYPSYLGSLPPHNPLHVCLAHPPCLQEALATAARARATRANKRRREEQAERRHAEAVRRWRLILPGEAGPSCSPSVVSSGEVSWAEVLAEAAPESASASAQASASASAVAAQEASAELDSLDAACSAAVHALCDTLRRAVSAGMAPPGGVRRSQLESLEALLRSNGESSR